MNISRLELDFFRNYLHFEGNFDPEINVIYGENAQGKTNLIEAIAYLSTARSHRARYDKELVQFGVNSAFIKGSVFARERDFLLEANLQRSARRQMYANGVKLKNVAEMSSFLNTVLFCPEDLYLIREGGGVRRRFLDDNICQLRPKYALALAEYKRLYEHKTRILRDWEGKPSLLDTLDEFSLQMARVGALIVHYRSHFIKKLGEIAPEIHRDFSGGKETLTLTYQTVSTIQNPLLSPKELFPLILEHQESHRRAELEARQCLTGPHKDDLLVEINGISAKTYGSQGQMRTAVLSLKLGCRELFFRETGEYPVLLLDDVLSELDTKRQEFVLQRITGGQVFITCCEEEKKLSLVQGKSFHIHDGQLQI